MYTKEWEFVVYSTYIERTLIFNYCWLQNKYRTFYVFHDHAQMAPSFKGTIHADHKWIFCKCQDITLNKSLLNLVSKNEVLFVYLLHGKSLSSFFMPNQIYSTGKNIYKRYRDETSFSTVDFFTYTHKTVLGDFHFETKS